MSIRYRLLLTVGLVSSFVFILAFFLNSELLMKNVEKIRQEGVNFREKSIEKKRKALELFLYDDMSRRLAQINAILETISQYSALSSWFAPTSTNLKQGTWSHAAHFLEDEDWIQFLQNTADSKILSLIVPEGGPFLETEVSPIEQGIAWVYAIEASSYSQPYLGIELPFKAKEGALIDESSLVISSSLPTVYVLYTLDHIRRFELSLNLLQNKEESLIEPSIQGYEVDEEKFYEYLKKAISFAKNPQLKLPVNQERETDGKEQVASSEENLSDQYLKDILNYSNELFIIGEITALQKMHFFDGSEKKTQWPDAISFAKKDAKTGRVFFLNSILDFSRPLFDDQSFFHSHPPKEGSYVSSGSVVVKSPHPNQAFFANTAIIPYKEGGQEKESFLTIGFDMNDFLYDVCTITDEYGCMVSEGKVLTSIVPQDRRPVHFEYVPDLIEKSGALKGIISIGDVEYFFIKLAPDPRLDFYFCFFMENQEAQGLFLQVKQKISDILNHVWIQRVILEICSIFILWILLLDLSKKITSPIITLSQSLRYVKTAEWNRVKIPEIKLAKNKEIKQLIESFEDMIEGMKEKEKMSAVLNKVVSKEIAQEILKGEVLLGGEERVVTMLFADIRDFTHLTQNMAPQDIISLLNTCMTKLSYIIEENKGVIDKYMGDGIMALYGAPVSYRESALCAVISGLEMIAAIQKWDEERIQLGHPPLNIGIGIHTGRVCAGNMGAKNRLNYTVIGSHVNMASRLCYTAGPGDVLITEDTYLDPMVQKNVEVQDQGMMSFKGFNEKKRVYKVIGLKNKDIGKVLILQGDE